MPGEKTRGYVLGAVAAASYGLNPLFALPLYGAGLGPDSVLFYRYLLAVVMLGSLMIFRRQSFALTRRDILPLAVMGLLFSFSSLCLFASYNYMDAGIASTILFLYPVMVAVIMSACFGERVTASTVLSILLALGGIGVIAVLANVAPRETHDICRLYFEGKHAESLALQLRLLELIEALFCDVNPIPVKEAMNLLGHDAGQCRMPLAPLNAANRERLRTALCAAGFLKA